MPAITVDDVLVLPRVPEPDAATTAERRVTSLTTAPNSFEGEGFPVKRAFAGVDLAALDPFVHMDQMGEVDWEPGAARGTSWHPHRGFETVTYMLDGTFQHEDSHGGGGVITDGDTQWMTAGSGLLHKEAPPASVVATGGLFQGVQLWVNLPARLKMSPPRYQDIRASEVKLLSSHDGGALLRVIAGDVGGFEGPGITHTPIALLHATISPGAQLRLPWRSDFNALVWAFSGRGTIGADRRPFQGGQLAVLGAGDVVPITADAAQDSHTPALEVLVLGGLPIREPVATYGPFVMNTRAELQQAVDDFNAGRLGTVPAGRDR
jgi:redox-sensitive bicupin YhaK (pirin superfamily)